LRRLINQVCYLLGTARSRIQYQPKLRRSAEIVDLRNRLIADPFSELLARLKSAQDEWPSMRSFCSSLWCAGQASGLGKTPGSGVLSTEVGWLDGKSAAALYTHQPLTQIAIDDVRHDLASGRAMNRLIQGDGRSGKPSLRHCDRHGDT